MQQLIAKIGHEHVMVRSRAMKNLLSKLEHGFITYEEILGQMDELIVNLLHWFNHDECPMSLDVLRFVASLVKVWIFKNLHV